jgi:hypothetical protein
VAAGRLIQNKRRRIVRTTLVHRRGAAIGVFVRYVPKLNACFKKSRERAFDTLLLYSKQSFPAHEVTFCALDGPAQTLFEWIRALVKLPGRDVITDEVPL